MRVFTRFLRDRRRTTAWWIVGVVSLVAFTVAFWPTVRGQVSFDEVVRELPPAMRSMFGIDAAVSIGSAPGYLHGRVFATMLPLLLVINAIAVGAGAIGGSETDGSLELLLAQPVSRHRVLAERTLATIVLAGLPALVAGLVLIALGAPVGLLEGVPLLRLVGAIAAALALALFFGAVALATGAFTGRRGAAVAVAAGGAVGGYLVQGLLAAADAPAAVQQLNPWHWYLERNMLIEGATLSALLLPLVAACVVLAAGAISFVRRDLI